MSYKHVTYQEKLIDFSMFLVPLLQCKKLVFEYAPFILINAEQFLEANDMCTILHACDAEAAVSEEVSLGTEASMHAAS